MQVYINDFILNLGNQSITTVSKNNVFRDSITKDFSYPFNLILTQEISEALGIIEINGIVNYPTKTAIVVSNNQEYFNGYLKISKIINKKATITLYYGRETLSVYDKKLNTLPFDTVDVTDVKSFAKNQNTKQWPQATHNFVTIRDTEFSKTTNYENFEGYMNNTDSSGYFIGNNFATVEEEQVVMNKNIMVPMPYIMEILKVGYLEENKVILGDFVDDVFNHKIVHVPENHLEKLLTTIYDNTIFNQPVSNFVSNNVVYSSYQANYDTTEEGTYILNFKLNLPAHVAEYFDLKITYNNEVIYSLFSENTAVTLYETLIINVSADTLTASVDVSLTLKQQEASISRYNYFVFKLQDEKLNVFENKYSLADFMPDITFREFVNEIENLFNLDVDVQDNVVYLNYLDNSMQKYIFENYSKYQIEEPIREIDSEKTYSLKLADESEIFVGKNGVLPITDSESLDSHTTIEIDVIPLKVVNVDGVTTAENTTETASLKLALYNGLVNGLPLAQEEINGRKLDLTSFYSKWVNWLKFRTASEVYEDSFFAHTSEQFSLKKGMYKYNKKHIIKEIKSVSVNDSYNKLTIISETF